jgi:hypothetical protein
MARSSRPLTARARPGGAGPRGRPGRGRRGQRPRRPRRAGPAQPACARAPPRVIQPIAAEARHRRRGGRSVPTVGPTSRESDVMRTTPASSHPPRLVSGTVEMPGSPGSGCDQVQYPACTSWGSSTTSQAANTPAAVAIWDGAVPGSRPPREPVGQHPARPRHHQPGQRDEERHAEQVGRARRCTRSCRTGSRWPARRLERDRGGVTRSSSAGADAGAAAEPGVDDRERAAQDDDRPAHRVAAAPASADRRWR